MKTVFAIQKEIQEIEARHRDSVGGGSTGSKAYKKDAKRVGELKKYALYLESNPGEESLQKQKDVISERIKSVNTQKNFESWLNLDSRNKAHKNPHAKFNEVMGITEMKAQIRTLNYLLLKQPKQ